MSSTMIRNSRDEKGLEAKQEGHVGNSTSTNLKASSSSTSASRQWSGFRNPRIVRVSRTFGGKDRHSKVSTIRGLRDRRIRLSVPTAIQLYDLQDRLGLSQPSKVIDWLLDATEHDIDKLPPLQVPHHGFGHHHHYHPQFDHDPQSNSINLAGAAPFFDHEADQNKGKSIKTSHQQDHDDQDANDVSGGGFSGQLLPHKLFPIGNVPTSIPGLLNNAMPYNYNYYNFNNSDHQYPPSSLSLSQFGSNHGFNYPVVPQIDHQHQHQYSHMMMNNGLLSSFSSSPMQSISSGSHQPQLFFCTPSTATLPSLFAPYPPYITSTTPVLESASTNTSVPNFLPNTLMPSPHNVIESATLKNNNGSIQLPNKDHAGS